MMSMKFVIANWKMSPATEEEAVSLAEKIDAENVVIASPFVFISAVGRVLKKAILGAQDVFWGGVGAHTGEISIGMLKNFNVRYVIVGHSEKRALGETDETINQKINAILENGLIPILCIGERAREIGVEGQELKKGKEFVRQQLEAALNGINFLHLPARDNGESQLIVAYEPVWAISTNSGGTSDTPENAAEMIVFIKEVLRLYLGLVTPKVLYGGSVNSNNAKGFLSRSEIDGVLVGGASLKAEEFNKIVKEASVTEN